MCLLGGTFKRGGGVAISGWCVFCRVLGQCISFVLILPVYWVWIVLEMFWFFNVSVWNMGSVSFGMAVPTFVQSLLVLFSGRVKCGARDVFGIWVLDLLSVGFL